MIGTLLKKTGRFFASPRLATLLLAFVGAWAVLASFVPQGEPSAAPVAAWASSNPSVEPVVRFLGLHHAFAAPLFLACVSVLAVSTVLCAWQRTQVALRRARMMRAAAVDQHAHAGRPDLEIACNPALDSPAVLTIARETLGVLGIKMSRSGDRLTAVSPPWSAWGSPVFHWALLALVVIMPLGTLVRSSGQLGLAVGQSAPDQPSSYGLLADGPLRRWDGVDRTIRLDAFDLTYTTGGVNRGPTPTVTVLDGQGGVVKAQRVYPNETLKIDALTIYPLDYGLSATVSIVETTGAESHVSTQLLDFSGKAEGGTAPIAPLVLTGAGEQLNVLLSVPLDTTQGGYLGKIPDEPRARVLVTTVGGRMVVDQTLRPGEDLVLPEGGVLRLIDVGYYARLQLVDDPSIPFLYIAAVVAMVGLGVATLARQMIVSVWVDETPTGPRLAARMRLWRNVTTSRDEIETELRRALGAVEEGAAQ